MNKALFLDRDGVLIDDVSYPHRLEDLHIKEEIIPHLKWASDQGFLLVIATNQAGIAKGKFTLEDYNLFQNKLETDLEKLGVKINATYYCPYHRDGIVKEYCLDSDLRKPKPGMFYQAKEEYNLDIEKSYMIGDKFSDNIELEGLTCYILESQYTTGVSGKTYRDIDSIFKEIRDANK